MKTASQQPAVFRLRRKTGLATLRDVWSFAHYIADRTGQTVVIEGVSRVRAGHLGASVPLAGDARTVSHTKPAEVYHPRKKHGLALKSDLQELARWLAPVLAQQDRSDDKQVNLRRAAQGRLPLPSGAGLLLREDFLAFVTAVGARLGFNVEAQDISGSRDTAAGIHVNRRARIASLGVTTQSRSGHGKACFVELADPADDGYYTQKVITWTYANGSYTETTTASGVVQGIGPDGEFDDCASTTFDSTSDSGFDYGAFVSRGETGTLVDWTEVIAAAAAEIADAGAEAAGYDDTWEQTQWRSASAATRSEFVASSSSALGYEYLSGVFGGWNIIRPKFKIANTGQTRLEIEITHTRLSDDEEETLDPIVIEPGAESDWIDTRDPDPGETWNTTITRIRMGGF